jgi:hypothetical protein
MSAGITDTATVEAPGAGPAADGRAAGPGLPGGEPSSRIGVRQAAANSRTLAWRSVVQIRHSPERLLDVILMPIVFLVLFLYVFGGVVAGSTDAYLEVLLPGLVAQLAMFATMGLGTALCADIQKGVFDRFRSLPVARSAPLIGAVIGDSVRFFAVMAVLTGFGSVLGFRFHTASSSTSAAERTVLRRLSVFSGGATRLPAGREDLHAGRLREHPAGQPRDRVDQVLAVVQDDE